MAAMDLTYIRGSIAAILSVLQHSSCPGNTFDPSSISGLTASFIRSALDCPLNYARSYLLNLLPLYIPFVVYLDIAALASTDLGPDAVLAAPEYCKLL